MSWVTAWRRGAVAGVGEMIEGMVVEQSDVKVREVQWDFAYGVIAERGKRASTGIGRPKSDPRWLARVRD